MNKDIFREKMLQKKGKYFRFTFNGSRNQIEEFSGKIIDIFPSIFLVKTDEEASRIRSFSYSDVITSNLLIHDSE